MRGTRGASRRENGTSHGPARREGVSSLRAGSLRALALASAVAALATCPRHALALEVWSEGQRSVDLNISLKSTAIMSHAGRDTVYYPEEWSSASLWRLRAVVDARPNDAVLLEVAYEHRARTTSEGAGAAGGSGLLLKEVPVPFRVRQGDWRIAEVGSTLSYRHEVDRAFVSASVGRADLTVGRQAVGWGRGLLFGAVDIFAPFSPLESDREWRRGIDAVRLRAPITDRISVEAVAALGESEDESALVGRVGGYAGDVDGALYAGARCEDQFYGASMSLPVLEAEVHGDAALFVSPDPLPTGGSFGEEDVAVKAVIGGSRTFDVGAGLLVVAEYHYSGFGVTDITRAMDYLDDSAMIERYSRGDSQILGRHATAVQVTYGFAGTAPLSLTWVESPVDGSGVVAPSVTWIFSDSVTLSAGAYFGYGEGPGGTRILSEYGGTPTTGLLQISFYY